MNTVVQGEHLEVVPTPNQMLKLHVRSNAIAIRMAWLLCYPSAMASWSSIYANALKGRFDLSLPKATVKLCVHGKQTGKKFFVTRLQVLELTALETPFEFAESCAPRHFVFHEGVHLSQTHRKAAAPTADSRIAEGGLVAPLTDEQWAGVAPLLAEVVSWKGSGSTRRHSLRDLVECIRMKLGTPYSWSKCPGEKSLVQSASGLLSKLQRAGLWERVVAVTAEDSTKAAVPLYAAIANYC